MPHSLATKPWVAGPEVTVTDELVTLSWLDS